MIREINKQPQRRNKMHFLLLAFLVVLQSSASIASAGDRSPFYQNCVKNCLKANCTQDVAVFTQRAAKQLEVWSQMLWNCRDECRYHCMWRTVDIFHQRDYETPKFHGKWPFYRVWGVQEPASTFTSLLNLVAHLYMHSELRRRFRCRDTPLVLFWHLFAAVCMNAWVWSAIFHTRDTPFTEFMDYAGALSMVMALFIAAIVRVLHRRRKVCAVVLVGTLVYYVEHARYLYSGVVDYDYNIIVNVVVGVAGSLIWLGWSIFHYLAGERYVWRVMAFTLLSAAALSLEVFDFPPRGGVWDAHALWHLSTAPLPLVFYRFVMDDLNHLQKSSGKTDFKLT